VNSDAGLDHYFPAVAVAPSPRDRVGVSYFRTAQIPNENAPVAGGFAPGQPGVQQTDSDYVLAGGRGLNTPFNFKVLSPEFPAPDGIPRPASTATTADWSSTRKKRPIRSGRILATPTRFP